MVRVTCRTPLLVLVLALGLGVAVAGCKRPAVVAVSGNGDAAVDGDHDAPPAPDAPVDTLQTVDAPQTADATDAPPDVTPPVDALDTGVDVGADASDARPEDLPCGTLGFPCQPFACDVAAGRCKSTCFTGDDCASGYLCRSNTCGQTPGACTRNEECASGVCAQGVCCNQPCDGVCQSCRLPAAGGVCSLVPVGAVDPQNRCPSSHLCNGRGACIPPSCTLDSDCGAAHFCTGGHCVPCSATCTTSAACVAPAVCVMRNFCSYCGFADAGASD